MGVITARPFSFRRGYERVLEMHKVPLTFSFCLSIKCSSLKNTGFVLARHGCCSGELAELLKATATCKEVPYLKGTWRKIIQLPSSVKVGRQIPHLSHNLSPLPRLHASQPDQHPPEQHHGDLWSYSLWERQECHWHGRFRWHSPLLGDSQSSPSKIQITPEKKTKGLYFHWARWLSYPEEEDFF